MSFKKELANAILLNMPDVHFHTEGFDEAVASIINLVDKEVLEVLLIKGEDDRIKAWKDISQSKVTKDTTR